MRLILAAIVAALVLAVSASAAVFTERFNNLSNWMVQESNMPVSIFERTLRFSWDHPSEPGGDSAVTTLGMYWFNNVQSISWEVVAPPPHDPFGFEKVEIGAGETFLPLLFEWRSYPNFDATSWHHIIFGLASNSQFDTPAYPRFFRIRHLTTDLWLYEFSLDGRSWQLGHEDAGGTWGDRFTRFYIGIRAFTSGIGEVRFDNFQVRYRH